MENEKLTDKKPRLRSLSFGVVQKGVREKVLCNF